MGFDFKINFVIKIYPAAFFKHTAPLASDFQMA
jgi:hypothetical protein